MQMQNWASSSSQKYMTQIQKHLCPDECTTTDTHTLFHVKSYSRLKKNHWANSDLTYTDRALCTCTALYQCFLIQNIHHTLSQEHGHFIHSVCLVCINFPQITRTLADEDLMSV